jgi:hypothetical protein
MGTQGWEAAARLGPLEIAVESFLDDLAAAGYAPQALAHRRSIVRAFVRWTRAERLAVQDLSEAHLAAFVKRRPHGRDTRNKELAALRRFLAHLRGRGMLPPPARPASPADDLAHRYVAYLRTDRGFLKRHSNPAIDRHLKPGH